MLGNVCKVTLRSLTKKSTPAKWFVFGWIQIIRGPGLDNNLLMQQNMWINIQLTTYVVPKDEKRSTKIITFDLNQNFLKLRNYPILPTTISIIIINNDPILYSLYFN